MRILFLSFLVTMTFPAITSGFQVTGSNQDVVQGSIEFGAPNGQLEAAQPDSMTAPDNPSNPATESAPGEQLQGSDSKNVPQGSDSKNDPATGDTAAARGPKYEAYRKLVAEGRAITAEIDKLFGAIPIGFPQRAAEQRQKIDQLKARQNQIKGKVVGAAIEAYRESPQADPNLTRLMISKMFTSLSPRLEDQKFDPVLALELAGLVTKSGIESREIYFQAFRAAFAVQDFERAEMMIQKVEETSKSPLPPSFRERLENTRKNWARELEIRRMESATDDLPRVKFETTSGDFVVELFENHAPDTVANFISLVEKGFYDGLIFHLVRPGVLVQSGCPNGNGTGHPGYKIACECYRDEIRHHFTGTISMSNNGRDTGGSQFFITHQPNPVLDGKYTAFGRVIENMDAVFDVATVDKTKIYQSSVKPTVIRGVTVIRKRDHEYAPKVLETVEDTTPEAITADLLNTGDSANEGSTTRNDQAPDPDAGAQPSTVTDATLPDATSPDTNTPDAGATESTDPDLPVPDLPASESGSGGDGR